MLDYDKDALVTRALLLLEREADRMSAIDQDETYYTDPALQDMSRLPNQQISAISVKSPDGRDAVDLMCDLLGGADMTLTVPAVSELQRDKRRAENVEAWLRAYWRALYVLEDSNLVQSAVWDAAVRGAIVLRTVINTEEGDDELPVLLQLRDYRHVYPVWRGTRLVEVFEAYERNVLELRLEYPDVSFPDSWSDRDLVTVFEWWNDTHKAFWAGFPTGIYSIPRIGATWIMEPVSHDYGCLPYTIRIPRGRSRAGHKSLLGKMGVSLQALSKLESALLTVSVASVNSPWMVYTDRDEEDIGIELRFGKLNFLLPDEKLEPLRGPELPRDIPVAVDMWRQRLQKQSFPDAVWGEGVGSNMAGYAIAMLQASGTRILSPIATALRQALSDAFSAVLSIMENLVIPGADSDGVRLSFFDDSDMEWVESELTAADVEGMRLVIVELSDTMPQDRDRSLATAQAMRQPGPDGRPLLSTETIYEQILNEFVDDPTIEAARIQAERLTAVLLDSLAQDVAGRFQQALQQAAQPAQPPAQPLEQPPTAMAAPAPGAAPLMQAPPPGGVPGAPGEMAGPAPGMEQPPLSTLNLAQIEEMYNAQQGQQVPGPGEPGVGAPV